MTPTTVTALRDLATSWREQAEFSDSGEDALALHQCADDLTALINASPAFREALTADERQTIVTVLETEGFDDLAERIAATPEPAPAHVHVIPTNRLTESPEAPHEHVCTCGFHYFSDEVATPSSSSAEGTAVERGQSQTTRLSSAPSDNPATPEPAPALDLRAALSEFLNGKYPNNGEGGDTSRLTWTIPERAFGPLRKALEALEATPEPAPALDVERLNRAFYNTPRLPDLQETARQHIERVAAEYARLAAKEQP